MASAPRHLSIPLPNGARISILHALPFFLVHLASLLIFFFPFRWYYLLTCLGLLVVRMFFVTAGYHRYFSHRSFKTSRVFQFVIAFMAICIRPRFSASSGRTSAGLFPTGTTRPAWTTSAISRSSRSCAG